MRGGEYLDAERLVGLWRSLQEAIDAERAESGLPIGAFLAARDSRWRLVGRVHFNLAENRKDAERPFAFLATYAASLAAHGALRHAPLGAALREYAGAGAKSELLRLLEPVHRASESCAWLKEIVETGEIFHPLRWTAREAMRLLGDVETVEQAGVVVRMPAAWRSGRPSRPSVEATVGSTAPSLVGAASLLDFQVEVSLDGEPLTREEIARLVASTDGLAMLRGKWVELEPAHLKATLDRYAEIERLARKEGLSFGKAMRLLAGADIGAGEAAQNSDAAWGRVSAGRWLAETLAVCRRPETLADAHPGGALKATLRPYQDVGLRWLGFSDADRSRRLPRRRHGARQDRPGAGAAADARRPRRRKTAEPDRRAGLASRQLGGGSRTLRAVAEGSRRPSRLHAGRAAEGVPGRRTGADRHRRDQLRRPAEARLDRPDALASRRRRRGAGDQEPRRQANPRGQGARRGRPRRAHRHADREQSARPVVDLRFPQSGAARLVEGVRGFRQAARRSDAALLRAAAQARRALHPAPAENRPQRHRRSSRQDRGQGLLRSEPQAGRPLSDDGRGNSRSGWRNRATIWGGVGWCWRR